MLMNMCFIIFIRSQDRRQNEESRKKKVEKYSFMRNSLLIKFSLSRNILHQIYSTQLFQKKMRQFFQSPPKTKMQLLIMDDYQVSTDPFSQHSSQPQNIPEYFSQSENSELANLIRAYYPHPKKKVLGEGNFIDFKSDLRWVLVEGSVKITTTINKTIIKSDPFVFCISPETCRMYIKPLYSIQQIEVINKSLFYIITNSKWKDFIRNALFIWNAQKIKFLQNSPFLELKSKYYIEDIAMNMNEITLYGHLYAKDDEADAVYWVKEGMVQLERKLELKHSSILIEYEKMFDQTLTKVENTAIKLIAKRGMLIGVDGLFIKNYSSPNPQSPKEKKETQLKRFYNVNSRFQCTLYKLSKELLEIFFRNSSFKKRKESEPISNSDPNRLCTEYTNLLKSSRAKKNGKKLSYIFEGAFPSLLTDELQKKKQKIEEQKQKKNKSRKLNMSNSAHAIQISPKKIQSKIIKNSSLPSLDRKNLEKIIKRSGNQRVQEKSERKNLKVAKNGKKQDASTVHYADLFQKPKKGSYGKQTGSHYIKVKSYRSLIPTHF